MGILLRAACLLMLVGVVHSGSEIDYILDGNILTADGLQCLTMASFSAFRRRTAPSCVALYVKEDTVAGTFLIESTSFSNIELKLVLDEEFVFGINGTSIKFSSGTEQLTDVDDLIDTNNPFLIILASEDATNPTNCLKSNETYGACNLTADKLYFDPSDCDDVNCLRCIPDISVCNICVEGYIVNTTDDTCAACATTYGMDCASCDATDCLSCNNGKVLKADSTSNPACTDPCDEAVANCDHCDVSTDTCSECSEGSQMFGIDTTCAEISTTAEPTESTTEETTSAANGKHGLPILVMILPAVFFGNRY